ncbi:MAG: hypothetical protein ACE37I_13660 [Rubinisphaera brasiliensis]|uniref:hypothetical protein n=1 Tax=Rubinisphaera brasiliensis TaxID=119 RepID=UPI000C64EE21|nr:hypothetical protein [Planctomyces sp.]
MGRWVIEENYHAVHPDGSSSEVSVCISAPYRKENDSYCDVVLTGLRRSGETDIQISIGGVDGLQAMELSIGLIKSLLEDAEKNDISIEHMGPDTL